MRGASGDECRKLVLGQEYNRPAEAGVLKKPRGSDFNFNFTYIDDARSNTNQANSRVTPVLYFIELLNRFDPLITHKKKLSVHNDKNTFIAFLLYAKC
jgi:hypothetical protein